MLPFTLDRTAEAIGDYATELDELTDELRQESEERDAPARRRQSRRSPPTRSRRSSRRRRSTACRSSSSRRCRTPSRSSRRRRATSRRRAAPPSNAASTRRTRAELNRFLRTFERRLTSDAGLPGRPWYRHQIYAPGQYTGYGVKTLPAIREAIEQRRWDEANAQIRQVSALLDAARAAIEAMTAKLAQPGA